MEGSGCGESAQFACPKTIPNPSAHWVIIALVWVPVTYFSTATMGSIAAFDIRSRTLARNSERTRTTGTGTQNAVDDRQGATADNLVLRGAAAAAPRRDTPTDTPQVPFRRHQLAQTRSVTLTAFALIARDDSQVEQRLTRFD